MSDFRILVVEDHPGWLDALKDYLQHRLKSASPDTHAGAVVVDGASTYADAMRYIQKETYDLIIVDLGLNGNSPAPEDINHQGMDLLRVIRQSPYNRDCALLVISGQQDITSVSQALSIYRVHAFLEKTDFKSHDFLEIARAAIRAARLKKAAAKTKTRYYLTVTFNQGYLTECRLTGPDRQAVYPATHRQRFNAGELIRRADNLNTLILDKKVDLWRPEIRAIGHDLFTYLLKAECFQKSLIAAVALVQHSSDLWLQFSSPAQGLSIPFELLYSGSDYFGLKYILTRRLAQSGTWVLRKTERFHEFFTRLMEEQAPLRMLIVGADVENTIPAAENEAVALKAQIESSLQALGIPSVVTLLLGAEATYEKVSEALRSGRYHLFHYAGHGLYDESLPEKSGLALFKNNGWRLLAASDLHTLVSNTELQMAFLNCCLGARTATQVGRGDFYGMLEAVAGADVPTVLGYRWALLDRSALRLAQVFYDTLWRTFSPGEALLEARIQATLGPKRRDDETWASPVLIMQNE